MSEEVSEQVEGSEISAAYERAEEVVSDKMASIFGDNAAKDEADEHEQEGIVDPDNPDGVDLKAEQEKQEPDEDPATVAYENATIEELRAAEREAAEAGDYEKASTLRDLAKAKSEDAQAAPKNASKSDFDPNLKLVAKELGGWTDKDIDEFVTANPTLARITFKKIADSYNQVSLQYAQAARNGAPVLAQPQTQQTAATQQQTATLDALYKNLASFEDVAGKEVVERFIMPLKTEVLEPLREVISFVNEQRAESVRREVLSAFESVAKDGFENFYGKSDSLTDEQRNNRQKVASAADIIWSGARNQGVPMSYAEAVRRAHLVANVDFFQRQARTQLAKSVKKRSTQITSRPTNRVARQTKTGDEAAMAAVDKFWQQFD